MNSLTTNSKSIQYPQYIATLLANGGGFAVGTVLGWPAPAGPLLVTTSDTLNATESSFNARFIRDVPFKISDSHFSWIVSIMTLGGALMCIPTGYIINRIGRKLMMLLMLIPLTIGWLLIVWANNLAMMYIGRFLTGLSSGTFCMTVPVYTGEIADKEIRGRLGSFFQMMVNVGILFVYSVGYDLNVPSFTLITAIIPILFGCAFFFMPETPMYFVGQGQLKQAQKSIQFLRGNNYDYRSEIKILKAQCKEINDDENSVSFLHPANIRALVIACGLMFFLQMCGINAVIFYLTDILLAAKTTMESEIATIVVGAMMVLSTLLAALFVDKTGRRVLLLSSICVMAFCTTIIGVYFHMKENGSPIIDDLGWLPLVAVCIFVIMFSIGMGPIPYFMVGELFTPSAKGLAASLATTTNFALAFVVAMSFTYLRDAIGIAGGFWFFSGCSIIGIFFILFIVPETKGKTFNEIQVILNDPQWWQICRITHSKNKH